MIGELLAGRIRPEAYLLLVFNLLPIYRTLESELVEHAHLPVLCEIVRPEIQRANALAHDVVVLSGRFPGTALQLLEESREYRYRIRRIAADCPERLLGHAYVRYLGDLSGGGILRRILVRIPEIGPEATQFYVFSGIDDLARAKAEYRRAIERAGHRAMEFDGIVEEAREAFRRTIALAEAVAAAASEGQVELLFPSLV